MKREELKSFDVFSLGVFCVFFGVWKREKRVKKPGSEQKFRKMCLLLGLKSA